MLPFNCNKRCRRTPRWVTSVMLVMVLGCLSARSFSQGRQGTIEKLPIQKGCEGNPPTLDVSSTRMTFDSKTRTFMFEEKVRILRCTLVITCDRLQVINGATEQNIERIIATGNVYFEQGKRSGVAERAEYFESEQKLVLTGKPRIWDTQESNELTGEEIVVLQQDEKVLVKQARVLFHPRKTSSKTP